MFSSQKKMITSLFFPSRESEAAIIETLNECQKIMRICVYTITNKNILNAILEQTKLKPQLIVQIITDDVQSLIPSSKQLIEKIILEGNNQIQVKLDNSPFSLMHNKYLLIDEISVMTGSFNWTNKAVTTNRENVVIIRSTETTREFIKNFGEQWEAFKLYQVCDVDQQKPYVSGFTKTPKDKVIKDKVVKEKVIKEKVTKVKVTKEKQEKPVKEKKNPRAKIIKEIQKSISKPKEKVSRKRKQVASSDEDDDDDGDISEFVVSDETDSEEMDEEDE